MSGMWITAGLFLAAALLGVFAAPDASARAALPSVEHRRLPNGLALYVVEHHELPVVSVTWMLKHGAEADPPGKAGLTGFVLDGLLWGTAKLDEESLSLGFDSRGIQVSVSSGWEGGTLSAQALAEDLDFVLETFAALIRGAAYPQAEFELAKKRRLASLRDREQELGWVAGRDFQEHLFAGTPYGHPAEGSVTSVEALSIEDVRAHYRALVRPDNAALAVVGDLRAAEVLEKVGRLFGGGEQAAPSARPSEEPKPAALSGVRVRLVERFGYTECHLRLGHVGLARTDPSYYPVVLMNYILGGGGFSSRLMEEIRVKLGYTYGINSRFEARRRPGPFVVGTFTQPAQAADAVRRILEAMALMREKGVAERELEEARGYFLGSYAMNFETPSKIAGELLRLERYGLPLETLAAYPGEIASVAKADLDAAARKYLKPRNVLVTVVGDIERYAAEFAQLGAVEVVREEK